MSVFTNPSSGSKEHARAYIDAVLGLLAERDPMSVLETTERELRTRIDGVSPKQLRTREAPGKWSIAMVLQHLADSELVWGWRMRLILAQDRPTLTGYDQDAWADELGYENADPERALADFGQLRSANLRLLRAAMPAGLKRVGVHVERGDESLAHQMKLYAGHDLLHLNQVARVRSSLSR